MQASVELTLEPKEIPNLRMVPSRHHSMFPANESTLRPRQPRLTRRTCELTHRLSVLAQLLRTKSKCRLDAVMQNLVENLFQIKKPIDPSDDTSDMLANLNLGALIFASLEDLKVLLHVSQTSAQDAWELARSKPFLTSEAITTELRKNIIQAFLDVHESRIPNTEGIVHEIDYRYARLDTVITRLQKGTGEFQLLQKSFVSGGTGLLQVLEIFVVARKNEGILPRSNQSSNNSLYYHGTTYRNLPSIFQQGLKLVNPNTGRNGQTHGSGIYFTDTSSIAMSYCLKHPLHRHPRGCSYTDGYMLVAELCLGETSFRSCPYPGCCTIVNHEVLNVDTATLPDGTFLPRNLAQIVVIQQEFRIRLRYLVCFRRFKTDD